MRVGGRRLGTTRRLGVLLATFALVAVPGADRGLAQEDHGTFRPVTVDGLGNPNNYGFHRLYQFQGYLWTASGNAVEGAIVYRSSDGENWEAVSPPGIDGDLANDSIVSLGWFKGANDPPESKGKLYAATYSFRASGQNGGDLWRANADAEDPADIVWEKITKDAFGDPDRLAFVGFIPFKDHLYAGTFNTESGAEIFRTATGDPDDWTVVAPRGMGDPECNTDFHLNIVFGDHVYFGSEEAGCFDTKGGEIWRTDGDLTAPYDTLEGWEKATSASGFGHVYNNNVFGMDVFQGHFYAATWVWGDPGVEVFRAPVVPPHEGVTAAPFEWEQVNQSGFGDNRNTWNNGLVHLGDTLYVAGIDLFGRTGGYLYRTGGGATAAEHVENWTAITASGFPPTTGGFFSLDGPFWLETFKGKVYMAVEQGGLGAAGRGQIWVYEPTNVPVLSVGRATECVEPGGRVTVTGTGFDDYQGDAYPVLNGDPIPVVKWTDTEIIAEVPPTSQSGDVAVYRDGETSNAKPVTVAVNTENVPLECQKNQFRVELSGAEEVGGGDPDGTGGARISWSQNGQVCFDIRVRDIGPVTLAHIHAGAQGVDGPIVVDFDVAGNGLRGCVEGVDPALLRQMRTNPARYYVNIHNAEFPAGALRGQLE